MASPTQWTWDWVSSGSWWWTGRPGVLRFMGSQRVGHDWATELNWTKASTNPSEFGSVQFSCSVVSDSLWPHESQHARPPCPSPTPGAYSNSCPSRQWCQPTISSSIIPFSCLQSFPASGSFQMSQFFAFGLYAKDGVSASASVLPMNIQDWFPLGYRLVGSPCSPRDSQESSPTLQFKSISSLVFSLLYGPTLTSIHDYWKNHSFD